ncbi:MAG: GNAT family N-acetyltransferase [Clostridiales bacterium]|nr:GNAT family N-acetyltransferase [Clostridiales bacterium]
MEFKKASKEDFDTAFEFIKALWTHNTYDKKTILKVYNEVISDENSFAFFLINKGEYLGFCHGDYFNTFWMSGLTCYISSIIVKEQCRGKGFGKALITHAKELALSKGCKAVILDSGLPRTSAHAFYEVCGFEKSCYGFELII